MHFPQLHNGTFLALASMWDGENEVQTKKGNGGCFTLRRIRDSLPEGEEQILEEEEFCSKSLEGREVVGLLKQ